MRLILNIIWLVLCGCGSRSVRARRPHLLHSDHYDPVRDRVVPDRGFALWPFGRPLEPARRRSRLPDRQYHLDHPDRAGGWRSGHLFTGLPLCLTIIGIPLGLANFKLIPVSLLPLGSRSSRPASPTRATTEPPCPARTRRVLLMFKPMRASASYPDKATPGVLARFTGSHAVQNSFTVAEVMVCAHQAPRRYSLIGRGHRSRRLPARQELTMTAGACPPGSKAGGLVRKATARSA